VPLERILARNDHLVIVATEAVAYEYGVELRLKLRARRRPGMTRRQWGVVSRGMWGDGDLSEWDEGEPVAADRHPDSLLRFGVRFADGTRVTSLDESVGEDEWPSPRPDHPVLLVEEGGGSGSEDVIDLERSLWLWPLPPPRPFEVAVEWPLLGVELTFEELDGKAIVAASARARPYWTD
jgi:hypothetical protein